MISSLLNISTWMSNIYLKLNTSKTELISSLRPSHLNLLHRQSSQIMATPSLAGILTPFFPVPHSLSVSKSTVSTCSINPGFYHFSPSSATTQPSHYQLPDCFHSHLTGLLASTLAHLQFILLSATRSCRPFAQTPLMTTPLTVKANVFTLFPLPGPTISLISSRTTLSHFTSLHQHSPACVSSNSSGMLHSKAFLQLFLSLECSFPRNLHGSVPHLFCSNIPFSVDLTPATLFKTVIYF